MKKNIIILTGGLSGSSVLAGLLATKGYWLGSETKKIRYPTNENSRLVDLNIEILQRSGYGWDDAVDIPPPSVASIQAIAGQADLAHFKSFVAECHDNSPWLWKDPRLCYTIYFWKNFLDLSNCKFILMSRDIQQAWTGIVLKGKMPITFDDLNVVETNCLEHSKAFFKQENLDFLPVVFEDLLVDPQKTIQQLNAFLEIDLNLQDFISVYKGPLYKPRWSKLDAHKAAIKLAGYKYIKQDIIAFPRKKKGAGSGWRHKLRAADRSSELESQ